MDQGTKTKRGEQGRKIDGERKRVWTPPSKRILKVGIKDTSAYIGSGADGGTKGGFHHDS